MAEVVTVTLAESAAIEQAKNEAITDEDFQPHAPLSALPPEYASGTTYARGALVLEPRPTPPVPVAPLGEEPSKKQEEEHAAAVAAYEAALATYNTDIAAYLPTVYRSQESANKGHTPKGDSDYAHWAPVPVESYPLQNPAFQVSPPLEERTGFNHADEPPASSSATAPPEETISSGQESLLGQ